MHQSKNLSISSYIPFVRDELWMFFHHTTNASTIGGMDRRNPFHHATLVQFLEVFVVHMEKYLMPQLVGFIGMR